VNRSHLAAVALLLGCRSRAATAVGVDASSELTPAAVASSNAELDALYAADQADRVGVLGDAGLPSSLTTRDDDRLRRVREILKAGAATTSADFEHAAMLFQHGHSVDAYREAHALALRAVELDPSNTRAKWLAAASKDRERMTLGEPQLYGTQFRSVDGGAWVLYPVDPSVTDEERARWNVPPLAEAEKKVARMNAERDRQRDR
jgi:hypothetical protein